jgi:hypothetical protein
VLVGEVHVFGWWERAGTLERVSMHLGGESMLECWEEEGGRILVVGALNIWRRKTCLGSGSILECWEDGRVSAQHGEIRQ